MKLRNINELHNELYICVLTVLYALILLVSCYLGIAFVTWDFNVANWNGYARFFLIIGCVALSVILFPFKSGQEVHNEGI